MNIIKNRINLSHLLDLAIGLSCLGFSYFMFFELNAILLGCFFLVGLIPVTLFLNYFVFGFNNQIIIGDNYLTYKSGNKRMRMEFSEIERVEIHELFHTDYWALGFKYVKYFSKTKQTLIITNLMSDSYISFNNIKPHIISEIFPIINSKWTERQLTKTESEKKSLEKRYMKLPNHELERIINTNSGYRIESKKIAQIILDKRKTAPNTSYI